MHPFRSPLALVVVVACSSGDGVLAEPSTETSPSTDPGTTPSTSQTTDTTETSTTTTTTTSTTSEDGTVVLTVGATPPNVLARVVTLTNTGAVDAVVSVAHGVGNTDRRTPEVTVPAGGAVDVTVLGLYPAAWSLAVDHAGIVGPSASVTTEAPERPVLPETEAFLDPSTWSDEEAICAAFENPPTYLCTDRQGRPTLHVPLPGNAMFVRPLADGTFVGHPDGPDFLVHFDAAGHELDRIFLEELKGTTHEHGWIDEHEVIEIVEGPWAGAWAVLTAIEERVGNRWIIGAGLVVFDPITREVHWDWSSHGARGDGESVDPLLPYQRTGIFDYDEDWLHANAVVHRIADDGTDTFWFSLRHQDWVVCIDAPSGAVRWRLGYEGDFALVDDLDAASPAPLANDQWMYHQHAPEPRRLGNGRTEVLLFDNGNARRDAQGRPDERNPYSRSVRYILDETTMQATVDWSYGAAEPSPEYFFSPAAGDADRLYDDSGSVHVKALGDARITDVADDGSVRWQQTVRTEGELYRAEIYPSLYETGWQATVGW